MDVPSNHEAEVSAVGSMLVDAGCIADVRELIEPIHLHDPELVDVCEAICELHDAHCAIDVVPVLDCMRKRKTATDQTVDLLAGLIGAVPSAANAVAYARIVRAMADRRAIIDCARNAAISARNLGEPHDIAQALHEELQDALLAPVTERTITDVVEALLEGPCGQDDVPWGVRLLDDKLDPMQRGSLVIVAGKPSRGKTALAQQIMLAAAQAGHRGVALSGEMGATPFIQRWVTQLSRVPADQFRRKPEDRSADASERLLKAGSEVTTLPLDFVYAGDMSVSQLLASAERHARTADIIALDYIQVWARGPEVNDIGGTITRGMKRIAERYNCIALLLSQMRKGEQQKRQNLDDLKGSGDLGQDADDVLLIHRADDVDRTGGSVDVSIIVEKRRNSEAGLRLPARFVGHIYRFEQPDNFKELV